MSKIKLQPLGHKLLINIPQTKTGALQVQQGAQIQEVGTILAVSDYVAKNYGVYPHKYDFKVGDTIHFKAWAIDIVTVDGETFYYLDADSDAICGKVQ